MSAPNKTDIQTLDFYQNGQPFAYVESANQGTNSLDFYQNAQPFVAAVGGASPPPSANANFFLMFG